MAERRLIRPGEYGTIIRRGPIEAWRRVEAPKPKDVILVGKDEYVSESEFEKLTSPQQAYLRKHGVTAFNVEQERVHKAANVRLATGEYVPKSEFEKLTSAEQAFIMQAGVEKFNVAQERVHAQQVTAYEEAVAFVERQRVAQEEWVRENIVEVGPQKEPILKSQFDLMVPEAQALLKELGLTEFNRQIEEATVAYEQVMSELTPSQRAEVEATGSYTIVESEADAVARVRSENPWATDIKFNERTGQITYNIPDPITHLRDNPGDISGLVEMGHDESAMGDINAALVETKDFWNEDGSFQGDRYLRLHPDREETLDTLGFTSVQIQELIDYNAQPLSKAAFTQMYFADRGWEYKSPMVRAIEEIPRTLFAYEAHRREGERYNVAALAYIGDYGLEEYYKSAGVELASVPLPALRALYPEVELRDITATEWAFTALIPITVVTAGLAGMAGIGLRGIALRGVATLGGAGITTLMGYTTVINWENMSATERAVSVGFTTLAALGTVAAGISTIRSIKGYVALRPTLKVADLAGKKNIVMVRANNAVKVNMSQRNLIKLENATRESIAADLRFFDKFSILRRIDKRSLTKIEKLTGMKGLKNAVLNLAKKQKAYEVTLASVKKTPITPTEAARLLAARNKYFDALDKFSDIAQPRSMHWRVPTPERTIIETEYTPIGIARKLQGEWNAVAAKLKQTKVGSSEYYRLIEKQQSMIRRSYALEATERGVPSNIQQLLDEINRYNKEHLRIAPRLPGEPPGRVVTALRPVEVVAPKVAVTRPAITEPKVTVTTRAAERAAAVRAPGVTVAPGVVAPVAAPKAAPSEVSVFPGITSPKIRVRTPTRTETVPAEHIGAMTPEQAQRLYGSEIKVDAIGVPMEVVKVGVREWMSPADAIKEAQRISAESAVRDMVSVAEQLRIQGATQAQINTSVQQLIQQATQVATRMALQQALQTQLKAATQTAVRTVLQTGITVITTTPITTPITPIIPFPIILPPKGKGVKKKKKYPAGTIVWRQGALEQTGEPPAESQYKVIFPPYDQKKPLNVSRLELPPEVRKIMSDTGTPQETLTFTEGKIPFSDVAFDLGVTDGFIDVKNKRIVYKGYGLETDVGKRIPSPTRGLSLEKAEALGIGLPKIRKTKRVATLKGSKPKPGVVTLEEG